MGLFDHLAEVSADGNFGNPKGVAWCNRFGLHVEKSPCAEYHSIMQIFTTKAYSELPDADEMRSNGPGDDVMILQNESGTIELEATLEEIEIATEELELEIDADVIPDEVMNSLIEHLNSARVLEVAV